MADYPLLFWTTSGTLGVRKKRGCATLGFFWTASRDSGGGKKKSEGVPLSALLDHVRGLWGEKKAMVGPRFFLDHVGGFWG